MAPSTERQCEARQACCKFFIKPDNSYFKKTCELSKGWSSISDEENSCSHVEEINIAF